MINFYKQYLNMSYTINLDSDGSLTKSDIVEFYKVLQWVENLKKSNQTTGFNIVKLKTFLQEKSIILDTKSPVKKSNESNKITFTDCKGSVCFSLLCHLRNAFAHDCFQKDGKELIIEDSYNANKTMYGRIDKSLLFDLINNIIMQKEHNGLK